MLTSVLSNSKLKAIMINSEKDKAVEDYYLVILTEPIPVGLAPRSLAFSRPELLESKCLIIRRDRMTIENDRCGAILHGAWKCGMFDAPKSVAFPTKLLSVTLQLDDEEAKAIAAGEYPSYPSSV